ncbi:MAG: DUF480 domain-containing protein [Planctomycetota bacterium]|jgi:uncharacterized protein YceH (UPF0502 family)
MTDDSASQDPQSPEPGWQPLPAIDRRVAGVLVEKAKTTPSAYPLSLNAICTACNQKSNRSPEMNLEPDDVEESLDRLRKLGAVGLVEGYGRVSKYRHYLYGWLGVDKVEIAVMAELMLRGPQTVGELRGRAARMEPIRDLAALQPVLASLKSKGLVIPLTLEGRGHVVAHAMYPPSDLQRIQATYRGAGPELAGASGHTAPSPTAAAAPVRPEVPSIANVDPELLKAFRREMDDLRSQVAQLRSDLEDLAAQAQRTDHEVDRLRNELGG